MTASQCEACGHTHQGASLAYICIGCPCPERPGQTDVTPVGTETLTDKEADSVNRWTPPFLAVGIEDLGCPICGEEGCIYVRKQDSYRDGEKVGAYCEQCHARLRVTAVHEPMFCDLEVAT